MKFSINEAKFKIDWLITSRNSAAIQQLLFRAFREMSLAPALAYKICTPVETYIAKNYVFIT